MKKLIILGLFLLANIAAVLAQSPTLKQVVVWGRTDESSIKDKRIERNYDQFGRLINESQKPDMYDHAYVVKREFQYNESGRLQYESRLDGDKTIFSRYEYRGDTVLKYIEYEGYNRIEVTRLHYFSRKPLEIKIFHDEILVEKTLFQYNAHDSLLNETAYDYHLTPEKKPIIKKKKVSYTYDGTRKTLRQEFDNDDIIIDETKYEYLADGNISEEDGIGKKKRHEYRQGKLWLTIEYDKGKTIETTFQHGKVINKKFFDQNQLTYVMDYEYTYW